MNVTERQPSTLVTVVAWLGLLWSGFTTVMGLMQSLFVSFMPTTRMSDAEAAQAGVPAGVRFMFDNMFLVEVGFTVLWAFMFVCSLGLLRRQEWARKGFLALLALGAVVTVALVVMQQTMMADMFDAATAENADARTMMIGMRLMSALLGVLFVGAMVWLAMRLNSAYVRAEFHSGRTLSGQDTVAR